MLNKTYAFAFSESSFRSAVVRLLLVALVVGSSAGLAIYAFNVGRDISPRLPVSVSNFQKFDSDLQMLRKEIGSIQSRLATKMPDGDYNVEIQLLRKDVERIDATLSRISAAILVDPAKALEVPLIQRDLEAMKQNQSQILLSMQQDITRLYAIAGGGIAFLLSVSIPLVVGRQSSNAGKSGPVAEKE